MDKAKRELIEKSLDDYIKLAQEKTQKWPEWKRNMFTPASTEQVKAELQNKPSWSDAPEWANWLGQDDDGEWWWFPTEPTTRLNCFYNRVSQRASTAGKVIGDWKSTLEKRPDAEHTELLYNQALKDFDKLHEAAAVVIEQHKQGKLTDAAIYDLENAI